LAVVVAAEVEVDCWLNIFGGAYCWFI
jgi:hypothetical protein